jgi:hypothetical protein
MISTVQSKGAIPSQSNGKELQIVAGVGVCALAAVGAWIKYSYYPTGIRTRELGFGTYVGAVVNGRIEGQGKLVLKKIDRYGQPCWGDTTWEGVFRGNEILVQKVSHANGNVFAWKGGERFWFNSALAQHPHLSGERCVRWTQPDGSVFEGTIQDGKEKNGKKQYLDRTVYEGDFVNGVASGRGTKSYPDDRVYEGEFLDGLEHGQGTLTTRLGVRYVGEFDRGKKTGMGRETSPHGTVEEIFYLSPDSDTYSRRRI